MQLLRPFSIILSAVTASLASPIGITRKSNFNWDETNFVLAFGDSWTYVQGKQGRQNFSFIGDRFDDKYTRTELLSNKIVKNMTSAGGPNWIEYLTGCYEGLPQQCEKQLWDFAFAGSDMSLKSTPLHHNFSIQFDEQVRNWNERASQYVPVDKRRALVATFIGINDIQDTSKYPMNVTGPGYEKLYKEMIGVQFDAMESLQRSGFNNFLVMGLPILDKSPTNVGKENPSPNSTMLSTWNSIIQQDAAMFEAQHPESRVLYFDIYDFLDGIWSNAAAYGLKNTTGYCEAYDQGDVQWNYKKYGCEPIQDYFWYNTGHITYPVHKYLGQELQRFLSRESTRG